MAGSERDRWSHGSSVGRQLGRLQQYGAVVARITFIIDAAILYITLYLALHQFDWPWTQRYVTLALLSIVVFGTLTSFRQVYQLWRLPRLQAELLDVHLMLGATFATMLAILYAGTHWLEDSANFWLLATWFALASIAMTATRSTARLALQRYRFGASGSRRVAFVGSTDTARHLAGLFKTHDWMGLDVVGIYDDQPAAGMASAPHALVPATPLPLAGDIDDLIALARSDRVNAIYITLPMATEQRIKVIIDNLADTTVSIHYCLSMFDFNLLHSHLDDVFGHPVISVVSSPFDGYKRHLKRIEDLVLTALILPVIAVPLALIALAIKLTSDGPVLYLQTRDGLDGRPFKIWKFRTMYSVDTDDEFVQARHNDARITPLGSFLRRTSLDELPQFFNVLAGHMSVVGPRPAPLKYNEQHRRLIYRYTVRHKVKPGITGLAQVSGCRGETESVDKTAQRTELDLRYIDTWSLWLDIRILWKTLVMTCAGFRTQ